MTNQLHESLADLAEEVPAHVVRDDLAARSWAAGRRRRWRRRAALVGAAVAVVAVVAPGVQPATEWVRTVQPAGSQGRHAAQGYPQRIGHQWWLHDLPDRPGPMAGIFVRRAEESSNKPVETWIAVSPTGRQWRIPSDQGAGANAPTLSATGRFIGYFPNRDAPPYVVHDLVTGERTVLDDVWPHGSGEGHPNMIHAQTPAFWAADDSRVLLYTISGPVGDNLLLTPDGTKEHVRAGRYPAGWIGSDRLAFMSYDERDSDAVTGARVTVTDTAGTVQKRVDLDLPRAFRQSSSFGLSQWSAVVSPDGRFVAVMLEGFSDAIYRFSLQDGRLVSGPTYVDGVGGLCPLGWSGDQPVVPTYPDQANGALAVLAGPSPRAMVVSDPTLHAQCLTLAASAANGEPHGLFGTSTSPLSWWWREGLIGGFAVVLLAWSSRRFARRKRESWGPRNRVGEETQERRGEDE